MNYRVLAHLHASTVAVRRDFAGYSQTVRWMSDNSSKALAGACRRKLPVSKQGSGHLISFPVGKTNYSCIADIILILFLVFAVLLSSVSVTLCRHAHVHRHTQKSSTKFSVEAPCSSNALGFSPHFLIFLQCYIIGMENVLQICVFL